MRAKRAKQLRKIAVQTGQTNEGLKEKGHARKNQKGLVEIVKTYFYGQNDPRHIYQSLKKAWSRKLITRKDLQNVQSN